MSQPSLIDQSDPRWKALYEQWIKERKPGHVNLGDRQYRVFPINDDEVKFQEVGGIDGTYASLSRS